ncbi:Phosphatidylglycerol/phosphatidylinositol transfer protein [Clonorchis sinensis]|uniref:Phosphatidylglycerol/phosphatidylinositol transfer protein n=1 Tax=Clonorchis sinensis TaxID=79923 RepID=A0A8T1MYQ4_CLOSI|nr:Phosphatidylglycerol/phosphatidylinositol transfer protein [Clonorchis sinensis]
MKSFNLILCSLILFTSDFGDAVSFRDCGSTNVVVTEVDISPCDGEPCKLVKGTSVTLRIRFRGLARIIPGGERFEGSIDGEPATISFPPNGVCSRLNPPCPIQPGQSYTYHYSGVVPEELRNGLLYVEWKLLNANVQSFLCVEILVRIAETP